jgi:H+/Cl- antiporter ClcA
MNPICEKTECPARGRILRIKSGFNPNSSSVGSEIPAFLAFAAAAGAIGVIVMNTLSLFDRRIRKAWEERER